MTPNKPEVAKMARDMIDMANSAVNNNALILIGRLADTITYNAEVMNKLVKRVEQLEAMQVKPQVAPVVEKKQGEYLELVLNDKRVTQVRCTLAQSDGYIKGKVYKVEYTSHGAKCITNEKGHECKLSMSLFVKVENEPVIGHPLQVLLKKKHVTVIKCVKSNSDLWMEGKAYVILTSTSDPDNRKVQSETGQLLSTSASLFVDVAVPTDLEKACEKLRSQKEDKEYAEQFFAVTRMFMGLPTTHLIHPRSL